MSIAIKMPALSPTMEEGTLAKWLVKVGDTVSSGDILAEIETDKATMEFEVADDGVVAALIVPEGSEGVKVGTVIATLAAQGEAVATTEPQEPATAEVAAPAPVESVRAESRPAESGPAASRPRPAEAPVPVATALAAQARHPATPLARRIAASLGIDLSAINGTGPNGRIVRADVLPQAAVPVAPTAQALTSAALTAAAPVAVPDFGIPHHDERLSGVRKVIARRLTESKQQTPHIYLSVDVQLDDLLELRGRINDALAPQGIKVSVNDFMIKALARALMQVPQCNVAYAGDSMRVYQRADISVAVAAPSGLITPIIVDAGAKSVSTIAAEMKMLAGKAREGKLQPAEYQGGTASLSNLGMFGIKQFQAVINPPQAMIMAIGAGEQRPCLVDGVPGIATAMTATGSFDHRAIDGADAAQFMGAFKAAIEQPLALLA